MQVVPLRRRAARPARPPRVLLITPPLTQLNTPYPATAYLTGFLAARGVPVAQADLSLETALALLSRPGLERLFAAIRAGGYDRSPEVARFLRREAAYLETVEPAVRLLQGRDPTFASRVVAGALPEGPRFEADEVDLDWAFGALGLLDRARWLATRYLYDLADLARQTVAPHFALSRYAESLAIAARSFDPLADELGCPPGLIDAFAEEALAPHLERARPDLVGLSVPFPGNLYGALRIAQAVRRRLPSARIALGGGYVNTELRKLREPRLFDLVDYVTLDDGERPLGALCDHLGGGRGEERLARTMVRRDGEVVLRDGDDEPDARAAALPAPSYLGLPLDRYLSVIESGNPMHRLWSDGRWLKLNAAHGCYWRRCTFCDVGLDYIARYDPAPASALVDRMEALAAETGATGFHFVDEAAPPMLLVELGLELLARGRCVSWWGNIRFEKTFTADVCRLLAASGCIAVSGGLEVASDRLLAQIEKGVTVAQVARFAAAFARAGVLVHAYLMYGFPTETAQETVDSLERVRQLFAAGAIHSAYWHRFALTTHSPIARDPERFGIRILDHGEAPFANNDLAFEDPTGCDHARFSAGLERALHNFMHGVGLDRDVRRWFEERRVPRAKVPRDLVQCALADEGADPVRADARLVWLGGAVTVERGGLVLSGRGGDARVAMSPRRAEWAADLLRRATPLGRAVLGQARESGLLQGPTAPLPRRREAAASFPGGEKAFARFDAWQALREVGLVEIP